MAHSYASVRTAQPRAAISYLASDMAKIYQFPKPSNANVVVGVISLGGGLFGSINANGVLTNGDVQTYLLSQGISAEHHPTIVIVGVDGATNTPSTSDGGSTLENTLDVEAVASCCATSNLTIILYIGVNTERGFFNVFNYAINTPVSVKGVSVKPTILSCSWGLPEIYASSTLLTNIHNLFQTATQRGINICVAAGDYGSSNGTSENNVDFPGSSPYVVCCGGTSLMCPNKIYDASTVEIVWNNNPTTSATGGGISKVFNSPAYQSALGIAKRSVPDIALNSDPMTGVQVLMNGYILIVGGTSLAAPTFAAYLACCNTSTFVHPLLYSLPRSCFHDIVTGNNGAYAAGVGYDACTGLGSIHGSALTPYILPSVVHATSVSIAPTSITATSSTPVQLTATISPANTTYPILTWTSGNPSVVSVNASGLVVPIANGTTILTVKTLNGKTAAISVSVSIVIPATSVSIDPTSITATTLSPVQLTATILPADTSNKAITWTSSNPSIATVSSSGLVAPIANGATTITVTTSNAKTASIPVSVSIAATSVSISPSSVSTTMTSPVQLTASILPANTFNKTITWASSNPAVAIVSVSGVITPVTIGTATVSATTVNGITTSILVTVHIQSIHTAVVLSSTTPQKVAAIIQPNSTNQIVLWSSSAPSVAIVDTTGLVTAKSNGTAVITATIQDNNKKSSINILVAFPPPPAPAPARAPARGGILQQFLRR